MTSALISRFTPSLMAAATLERVLVQRNGLADRIFESIVSSALTSAKHHSLIVSARGMGKTHLVSLLYHRVVESPSLSKTLAVAWLREEEWGVTSLLDF